MRRSGRSMTRWVSTRTILIRRRRRLMRVAVVRLVVLGRVDLVEAGLVVERVLRVGASRGFRLILRDLIFRGFKEVGRLRRAGLVVRGLVGVLRMCFRGCLAGVGGVWGGGWGVVGGFGVGGGVGGGWRVGGAGGEKSWNS